MHKLSQNLYITYSNQRARDLKATVNPLDKVMTLENFILEQFEQKNFQLIIDDTLGASILHKLIQEHAIEYFTYLDSDADGFGNLSRINVVKKIDSIPILGTGKTDYQSLKKLM